MAVVSSHGESFPTPQERLGDQSEYDYLGYRGISLHPYPATMPLPLARDLVSQNSDEGDLVLDPFAGSGTTLRAAALLGRRSVGIDLNPLACLISRVAAACGPHFQLRDLDYARQRVLEGITARAVFPSERYRPWIERWFSPLASERLAQLAASIANEAVSQDSADFVLLAFSRTVRRCSQSRPGELKLWKRREEWEPDDPVSVFNAEAVSLLRDMAVVSSEAPAGYVRPIVIHGDSQYECTKIRDVDLVLTSPPYGDSWTTVAYGNFSLLSRIWLGAVDDEFVESDPTREDALTPGGLFRGRSVNSWADVRAQSQTLAEAHSKVFHASTTRAEELLRFFDDMYSITAEAVATLKLHGRLIMVVGPRTVAGVGIDTGAVLAEFTERMGMVRIDRRLRRVTGKRLPTKTLQGANGVGETINAESIDLLKKVSECRIGRHPE